jgi:hypothetical protein
MRFIAFGLEKRAISMRWLGPTKIRGYTYWSDASG